MSVILVVDDSPQMAGLLQDIVEMAGYEAEVAYSGLDGLDKAREGMPDLLDKIADERSVTSVEELLAWLEQHNHPALVMDPIF